MKKNASVFSTASLTRISVLAAVAILLFQPFLEFALPFFPPWLKLDASAVPVLLAGFALGPVHGLIVQLLKSALHLLQTNTMGVGELADFVMGASLMLPAALIYARKHTLKAAMLGLGVGIVCACIAGVLTNLYILLPLYMSLMGESAIIAGANSKNQGIVDIFTYVTYAVVPFNLLKGFIVSLITFLLYKRLRPLLKPGARKDAA